MPNITEAPATLQALYTQHPSTATPLVISATTIQPTPGQKYTAFRTFLRTFLASYIRRHPEKNTEHGFASQWQESSVDVLARHHPYLYIHHIAN